MKLLFCGTRVDTGPLVDRLNAVYDDLVAYIDAGSYDHVWSDGLSELYFSLEGA